MILNIFKSGIITRKPVRGVKKFQVNPHITNTARPFILFDTGLIKDVVINDLFAFSQSFKSWSKLTSDLNEIFMRLLLTQNGHVNRFKVLIITPHTLP